MFETADPNESLSYITGELSALIFSSDGVIYLSRVLTRKPSSFSTVSITTFLEREPLIFRNRGLRSCYYSHVGYGTQSSVRLVNGFDPLIIRQRLLSRLPSYVVFA